MTIDQIINTLTLADQAQIAQHHISLEDLTEQLNRHINGFPALDLIKPALLDQGVRNISSEQQATYIQAYEKASKTRQICKFVPASGAASRMFRDLFAYLNDPANHLTPNIQMLFDRIEEFAFYTDLKNSLLKDGWEIHQLISEKKYPFILDYLLTEKGLNYGQLPKALLAFHIYPNQIRSATEEHLAEGGDYAQCMDGQVNLHFTVSASHQSLMETHLDQVVPFYENTYQATYHITLSNQDPSTDTIAVSLDNLPFRDEDNQLLFRPGGHGALLKNLNQISADLVFIKNIDNLTPDHERMPTITYKKLIGGVLITYQEKIFYYLSRLQEGRDMVSPELMMEIWAFIEQELCIRPPHGIRERSHADQQAYLIKKLNRPIRVVGLVSTDKNTGGGPFWVKEADGTTSLQVVETAQIDMDNPAQKAIAEQSGYANITDLVCGMKDYQGNPFNLMDYRDPDTGFISLKSKFGRDLKALELPGLWNGSMADWITVFVEVPKETFHPVKTVFDLIS